MDNVNYYGSPAPLPQEEYERLNKRFYQNQQDIQMHQMMAQGDMMLALTKSEELSKIHERHVANIEQIRANVAAQKSLQKMEVIIDQSGEILLKRELFGGDAVKALDIVLDDAILICPYDGSDDMKLVLRLKPNNRDNMSTLTFCRDQLGDKAINKIFNRAGIFFGFSHRLETMVRRLIVVKCSGFCEMKCVPSKRGWQKRGEELVYVGPEEKIWKEY